MRPDKEIKAWFKEEASKDPDTYYATAVLRERGFQRKQCGCGTWFWTVNAEQGHCGDASCAGGFTLFKNNPCSKELSYTQVWQAFARMFAGKGYAVVPRYPVVARWNPTMDFTIASIAAFQPYVVSGEVDPPAERLVIPQFCLRFGDVDNVGVTMNHMTGFVMIGQHAFKTPGEWDQDAFFRDICDWLTDGLGLPYEEVTFHEDAWAGGGNFGPCMEYFSRGVELGNQVYMLFEQDDDAQDGYKELSQKVLDMGMGHERNAWFSQGRGTIYDATFPAVIERLKAATGVAYDEAFVEAYTPYAAFLNLDEVEDIGEAWTRVSQGMGVPVGELRAKVEPLTALYAVAEHARSLLFALSDGALPGNVGGGYNLRAVFRRAQGFIEEHGWKVDLGEVAAWHADELGELFPELRDRVKDVRRILKVELRKHRENRERSAAIIERLLEKESVAAEELIRLYDEKGVQPEQVAAAAKRAGKKVTVPENFYALVAGRQEGREQKTATRRKTRIPVGDVPKTSILYYDAWDYVDFESPVLAVIDGDKAVLERTAFYPTSGGQEHDVGTLNGVPVKDVVKQDGVVVHVLAQKVDWPPGSVAAGKIDIGRREQLAQHHTATHIINGAARRVLGDHVWQAGAAKTEEKGRIDITHYEALSDEELRLIEQEANRVVRENLPVRKTLEPKNLAEAAHGFRLYQGGAVPGAEIRVVDIPGFDVEACGGTHLNTTGEAGYIRILGSSKVQDGVVRIEFTAGTAAAVKAKERGAALEEVAGFLGVAPELVPAKAEQVFRLWRALRKAKKKGKEPDTKAIEAAQLKPFDGDALLEAGKRLQTQDVLATLKRFTKEIAELKATS